MGRMWRNCILMVVVAFVEMSRFRDGPLREREGRGVQSEYYLFQRHRPKACGCFC